jgi:integrase
MFRNKGWDVPDGLGRAEPPGNVMTLWDAVPLFLRHPEIRDSPTRERHEQCLSHIVEELGMDLPVKHLWIPEIKEYQIQRLRDGAAPGTVNREKSTLSRLFQVLIEYRHVDVNPARLVKNLSEKSGERQVYIGAQDFKIIAVNLPGWFRPIAQTAYFTGMRRGEIRHLKRQQVNLARRMIVIGPEDTKEGNWKRVPIHGNLVPILEDVFKIRSIGNDLMFVRSGNALSNGNGRRPWEAAVRGLGLQAMPHFHDLRHTWKTNARRSGMDPEIREAILGHWFREKTVMERYGRISDQELTHAIDVMTFDHGETEILVAGPRTEKLRKRQHLRPGKMLTGC